MMPENPLEKYRDLYKSELEEVDNIIIKTSSNKAELINLLVSHILKSGGKRLRPVLLILASKHFNISNNNHIKMAACVELLHTATLFHDDVVDESKLRRGKSSANDLWGNSASVLVGDYLLAQAFKLMSEVGSMEVIDTLSETSSIITEGEIKQLMMKQDISLSFEDYIQIITAKTAELFAASCKVSSILTDQGIEIKTNFYEFGLNLGIAFQIIDDMLDYSADQQSLGKTIGDDFREGKITLPIIELCKVISDADKARLTELLEDENETARDDEALQMVLKLIEENDILQKVEEIALDYSARAKNNLRKVGDSKYIGILNEILEFSVERKY